MTDKATHLEKRCDVDAAVDVLMGAFDVLSPGDHAVAVIVGELGRQGEEIRPPARHRRRTGSEVSVEHVPRVRSR